VVITLRRYRKKRQHCNRFFRLHSEGEMNISDFTYHCVEIIS
jgi:hypothetical protein